MSGSRTFRKGTVVVTIFLLMLVSFGLGYYVRNQRGIVDEPPLVQPTNETITTPLVTAIPTPQVTPSPTLPAPVVAPVSHDKVPEAEDVVYQSRFQGNLETSGWTPFAGDWIIEDQALVQRQSEGFDHGISYRDSFEAFVLQVTFQHLTGVGGGIFFNMSQPDSKNGSHMVRFTDDGTGLFWGYFDPAGEFAGQGFASTPPPGPEPYLLEIISRFDTYDIHLNRVQLAQGIPLISKKGRIGLTSSQSSVRFDDVLIYSLGSGTAPPIGLDLLNLDTISGEWIQEGNTIRQINEEPTDYILRTSVNAQQYTLSIDITTSNVSAGQDVGGGIIFHMPTQDSKQGAHMARLANGGQGLFWGYFDEDETFIGDDWVGLNSKMDVAQTLTIVVTGQSYTIKVNDETIATEIPLNRTEGWIGLVSFSGPVTFSDLRLALGGNQLVDTVVD